MESIHIRQRLRPKRHAFVIQSDDLAAALKAVSLNTTIWGGLYNPIIPLTTPKEYQGLLKEFDPDELVDLSKGALPDALKTEYAHRIIAEAELVHRDDRDQKTYLRLGFDMLPIFEHIHEKEVRFVPEKSRASIITTELGDGWPEYLAFRFGSFSHLPNTDADYEKAFEKTLEATRVTVDPHGGLQALRGSVSALRTTGYGLRLLGGRANFSSHIIYLGDHQNLTDLVEFWNIRATGRMVLFVPVAAYRAYEASIRAMAEAGHYAINPHVDNHADFQRGPSVPETVIEEIVGWAKALSLPISIRMWRPRFGLKVDMYVGDIHVAGIEAQTGEEISMLDGEQMTPAKAIVPDYLDRDSTSKGDYSWALEISMMGGGFQNELMLKFPAAPGVERVLQRSIMGMRGEVRLGPNGIVLHRDDLRTSLYLRPAKTNDVFAALFKAVGLEIEPSQPGRYTEQIIKRMGFLQFDCRVFKIRGVREILHRLSNGSVLRKGNMHQIVMSVENDGYGQNWRPSLYEGMHIRSGQGRRLDFTDIFNELLEKRAVRPGFTLKCGQCFGEDWYHVSEFDEEYTCRFCFSKQRVDFGMARDWEYKADGMFRMPDGAFGSLAVIVSLWRFAEHRSFDDGRYVTSFLVRDHRGTLRCEVDYAYLVMGGFDASYELVLGQAAGFMDFTQDDMTNMKAVADRFDKKPYLAFTTLKDAFSDQEKQFLKRLAEDGYNVIAFTREEVDPYDLYDRFEHAPSKYAVTLRELSRNTMHLNVLN